MLNIMGVDRMPVTLTPSGTHGGRNPGGRVYRSISKLFGGLFHLVRGGGPFKGQLLLTTVGARSGQERTAVVMSFPQSDGTWLVVASAGGATKHPAWYLNMARNPDQVWIEIGGGKLRVTPESLHGAERQERWRQIVATRSNFGAYEQKTDREIPVIRLTPAER
jgi:deazaflavin-dependent oxidoreductase (nitroreductase family)